MKRIAVILIIFLAVGVGTYARVLLTQQPSSSEPIEKGGIYQIGFCTTSLGVQNEQYIRVVRELARGWVEVELEALPRAFDPAFRANDPYRRNQPLTTMRLNLNAVCSLKPANP